MTYNFPINYLVQNPWWNSAIKSLRGTESPDQKSIASARGELSQWFWRFKNLRPYQPEPFSAPVADLAPRVEAAGLGPTRDGGEAPR